MCKYENIYIILLLYDFLKYLTRYIWRCLDFRHLVMLFFIHANKCVALLSGITQRGNIAVIMFMPSVEISCFPSLLFSASKELTLATR